MAGVSAINTIQSVMSINLDTLRPEPCVEGYTTPGGYSGKAVKPIALAKCMELSSLIQNEFEGVKSLSGIGGVETGNDAAEFLLLGASTVQVSRTNLSQRRCRQHIHCQIRIMINVSRTVGCDLYILPAHGQQAVRG